ncbi:type II toxin-antitoxin system TacA family antitoxin [Xanthomonas arboricola]
MVNIPARFDLRLNPADKARISRAADLRGKSLSDFVRDAVMREVESVMAAELTLSVEESKRFLKALDAPFQPNANLDKALSRVAQG